MKIFIKTFGCRVNQVESEAILEEFLSQGHTPVSDFKEAEICLINTCSVTKNADKDVEKEVRHIIKHNPAAKLIITGCYAMAHKDEIAKKFPTAQTVFKADIGPVLFEREIDWTVKEHDGKTRAFVKIQDGCDCFCSYCIVPYTRPNKTSKPKATVIGEVKNLIANGYREIVLTGINIGNYRCAQTGADLAALTKELFTLEGNFRIRFSSIEINTITDDMIEALANGGQKACNYLHLPLQSGCDAVLASMRRRYNTKQYLARVDFIRQKIKNVALFCDIIAGYPTETKEDFEITKNFLRQVGFAGLHVFSYSIRPGTDAAKMPQLPPQEIKRRAEELRSLDKELRAAFAAKLVGTVQQFLAEDILPDGTVSGIASDFVRIHIPNGKLNKEIIPVKIISADKDICIAQPI